MTQVQARRNRVIVRDPATGRRPLTVGNLSLPLLLAAWDSPRTPENVAQAQDEDRERMLREAQETGAVGIEDLLGWGVVEPRRDEWNWDEYRRNAQLCAEHGLQYICFGWPMILPQWVRSDSTVPRARCLDHGEEVDYFSIFSDWCMEAFDRFYGELARGMGDVIDVLRLSSPYDFGETAYPMGPAAQLFPLRHIHTGYWASEPDALRHHAGGLRERYGTVGSLNRAWASSHDDFAAAAAAELRGGVRQRLDYLHWYHEGFTERMRQICLLARKHFPDTQLLFNLGWPFERPDIGQDIPGLIDMAGEVGVEVRAPTGPHVPFIYSLRVRGCRAWDTVTSGEAATATRDAEATALRVFRDLSLDHPWYFEYAPDVVAYTAAYGASSDLPAPGRPRVRTAVIFSRSDYWTGAVDAPVGTDSGYPHGLPSFVHALRAHVDFDVLDDRQVASGALGGYDVAVWPLSLRVDGAGVATALSAWLRGGGHLVAGARDLEMLDGARLALRERGGEDSLTVLEAWRPVLAAAAEEALAVSAYDPTAAGDVSAWAEAILPHLPGQVAAAYRALRARNRLATETERGWLTLRYGARTDDEPIIELIPTEALA